MKLSLFAYVFIVLFLEIKAARTRIVVPNNNNPYLNFPQYAGIAQNGNPFPTSAPGSTGNGDYQCVPSGSCPGGTGEDEIDIRIVTPVSQQIIHESR